MVKTSLFAADEREARLNKLGDILQDLDERIDFVRLAAEVDKAVPRPCRNKGGRPPFPTAMMVRIVTVQYLHNLSDEQTEYQLLDRLSFQRFVGLRQSSHIPDRTTIWTFKERLSTAGAGGVIFDGVQRQLSDKGYVARCGQMIDATLVQAPVQHIRRKEREQLDQGDIPEEWSAAKQRQKDTDASWTKKHGKWFFGMKLSASTDCRYKVIRKLVVSTASEHDSKHFEQVLDAENTNRDVFADRGYADKPREEKLKQQGWRPHIQRKAKKGQPLSACQKKRNHSIAKVRARVEHPFASLEQMGGKTLRSIGLARASMQLHWRAALYNMRRLCYLERQGIEPLHSRVVS